MKNFTTGFGMTLMCASFLGAAAHAGAAEPSVCRGAKFSAVLTLAGLPPPAGKLLGVDKDGMEGIAERGAPFNKTDVILGPAPLPMRRFHLAAVSADCILVAAEQGGIAYSMVLAIFVRNGAGWQQAGKQQYLRGAAPNSLDEFLGSAQYAIGEMYLRGDSVPASRPEALKWLRLAAGRGNADAREELGKLDPAPKGTENGKG